MAGSRLGSGRGSDARPARAGTAPPRPRTRRRGRDLRHLDPQAAQDAAEEHTIPTADHDLDTIRETALKFIAFCDGLEAAGLVAYAQRGRQLADETVRLANELAATRPLTQRLVAWRSSVLVCGKCRRLVVTADSAGEKAA